MDDRRSRYRLIARVCLYNALFYAALIAALLHLPQFSGSPGAGAGNPAATPPVDPIAADAGAPLAGTKLIEALRGGGHVLFVRHFPTASRDTLDDHYKAIHGRLRPEVFEDCSWQRPLSDSGLTDARETGKIIRELGIPIGTVHSSPYCRAMETAQALFEREPERDRKLIYRNDSFSEGEANRHLLERHLMQPPAPGRNNVVVGHRPPMDSMGGIEEGETLVFRAGQGRLYLVARIAAGNWKVARVNPDLLGKPATGKQATRTIPGKWFAPPRERYPEAGAAMLLDAAR